MSDSTEPHPQREVGRYLPTQQREPSITADSHASVEGDLVRAIGECGYFIPHDIRDRVISQGKDAIPTLLALARTSAAGGDHDPGLEWACVHAVDLLRDIGDPSVIEPLLEILVECDPYHMLQDQLIFTLSSLGEPVLEPALALRAESSEPWVGDAIAVILARLGVRDERIFPILVEHLARDPAEAAICLADYGDPRAIEHLHRAFDDYELTQDEVPPQEVLFAIESSLKRLGSDLSPAQRLKYEEAEAVSRILLPGGECAPRTPRVSRTAGRKQRARSKKKRKQQRASRKKNRG